MPRIDIGLTVVTCALLTWILFSGDVFKACRRQTI
jgi:hypothetical protein